MRMYSLGCVQYIPEKTRLSKIDLHFTVQTVSELISLFVHCALYNVAFIFTVLVEYVITSESCIFTSWFIRSKVWTHCFNRLTK